MATCELSDEYDRKTRAKYKATVLPCHRHHGVLPDTGKAWRWARINGRLYYDLARLPNRQPTRYRDRFGDAEALIKHYQAALEEEQHKTIDKELAEFIKMRYEHYLKEYPDCTPVQQAALAKACAVLDFTAARLQACAAKGGSEQKACQVYREVCAAVARQDLRYLPKNPRVLRQKVESMTREGQTAAQVVRLPRAGNTNATRFNDPVIAACAMKMRAMPQNYTNEFIIRTIQNAYKVRGQKVPGRRWFGTKIFEQPKTKYLTASGRYGQGSRQAFEQTGYIPMQNALFAGDCWQVDATRVNMIEHAKGDKSSGKGFLFIVAVRDVHSGDLLGYSFDYSENRWAVMTALKMAVQNTGYLPYELVTDRFPGHNTDEVKRILNGLKRMGVEVTTTHRPTGKAHLERAFSTLQTVFMQKSRYYYGEGVQSRRPYAHRAPEYLKALRKEASKTGFDFAAAWHQAVSIVESYRNTKLSDYSRKHASLHKSPAELHQESQKPNVTRLEAHQISMLFGLKKKVSLKHNGQIRTEIQKAEYIYHVDDFQVQAGHKEVILSYDLEDLDKVFLFKQRGDMLVYLCQAGQFRKPQPYGPGKEIYDIADASLRLQGIEKRKTQELKKAIAAAGNEVELIMGPFTERTAAEEAETARLLPEETEQKTVPRAKAVGDDLTGELDIDDYIINQM